MSAKVNSSQMLYQVNIFKLVTENITMENGVTTNVHILRHPGASAIVPLIDPETLVMIHQYRHAIGKFIWEIPAGTLSIGEDPKHCAHRELIEETGYSADNLYKLGEITPVPGYSDERIHIFLADNLQIAEQNLDRDEYLKVEKISFSHVLKMIETGEIQDSKSIASIFMARQYLENHR